MSLRWRNWSGRVECAPAAFHRPADAAGVVEAVRESASAGRKLRVAGSGHSFSPLVATSGTLLSLERLSGLEDVDVDATRATVRAGTTLHALGETLDGHGLAMENLGDIDRQSLAGAIATGTHGTGASFGSLSTQVVGLRLVTAAGDVIECSDEREPDLFKAAQVSLGALGVVVAARLRLRRAYRLRYQRRREGFEECAERIEAYRTGHRHFELYWFPHTDAVQVKLLDETGEPADPARFGDFLNDVLLENAAFGAMSRACRALPSLCPRMSRLAARFVSEGTCVRPSFRAFATRRLVRFQEMEYALPADRGIEALRELKEHVARKRVAVHFPVELRYVKADDIWLSPCYRRDTAFVAVHMYRGMEFAGYFDAAESIFRGHGGRPHWGKMHGLTARELARLYPRWEAFRSVRRRLDPSGLFLTPYLETLLEALAP
jgi:FAD-linked oxidoreductase